MRLGMIAALLYLPQLWLLFSSDAWSGYWWSVMKLFPLLPGFWGVLVVRGIYETDVTEVLGMALATALPFWLGTTQIRSCSPWRRWLALVLAAIYGSIMAILMHLAYWI
ncbi:MAG: hypothetical protein DRQ55_07160 [Planctomycetota bacterium]|nr:MAG: hypothetical protein DRQ55_07160 [Planctomycetota bacterium]